MYRFGWSDIIVEKECSDDGFSFGLKIKQISSDISVLTKRLYR